MTKADSAWPALTGGRAPHGIGQMSPCAPGDCEGRQCVFPYTLLTHCRKTVCKEWARETAVTSCLGRLGQRGTQHSCPLGLGHSGPRARRGAAESAQGEVLCTALSLLPLRTLRPAEMSSSQSSPVPVNRAECPQCLKSELESSFHCPKARPKLRTRGTSSDQRKPTAGPQQGKLVRGRGR